MSICCKVTQATSRFQLSKQKKSFSLVTYFIVQSVFIKKVKQLQLNNLRKVQWFGKSNMTKTKLTLLIAFKSIITSTIAMVISLYVSLLYLPRPSVFHPEKNPNPPILWGSLFLCWIIILGIIGLAILLKNKFMAKTPANKESNTAIVEPLITAWVIFLMVSIPSGVLTMRIVNYFSPSLRSHTSYHLSEAIRFNDQVTLAWLLAVANSEQTLPLVDQAVQANSDTCLNLLFLVGVKPRKEILPLLMIQGAATGNNDMIKLMMDYGISLDTQTSYGQTPLIAATEQDKLETIEFLIKSGANVNLTPKGSYPVLIIALLNDNNAVVKSLIKAGIDVKGCKLQKEFSLAGKVPNEAGERPILILPADSSALMLAAASANLEAVKTFLALGANASESNSIAYTALMYAKASGCQECEQALTRQ